MFSPQHSVVNFLINSAYQTIHDTRSRQDMAAVSRQGAGYGSCHILPACDSGRPGSARQDADSPAIATAVPPAPDVGQSDGEPQQRRV